MNLLLFFDVIDFLKRIIQGPLLYPLFYSDLISIFAIFSCPGIISSYDHSLLKIPAICAAVCIALFVYQISTQTLVTNGIFEQPTEEMQKAITKVVSSEGITKFTVTHVTNFNSPELIVGRFHEPFEIYFSSHFETPELFALIPFFLKTNLKVMQKTIFTSLVHAISLFFLVVSFFVGKSFLLTQALHPVAFWTLYLLLVQCSVMTRRFVIAFFNKQVIFSSDIATAREIGAQEAITALENFNQATSNDLNLKQFKSWELFSPKFSDRISRIKQAFNIN
ncbi:hypothetical protein FJ366_01740 [Candidatus Dependentiae bacterium]|nr:hypothetical protein [Candidatus Dependentiae bacterium]